MTTFLAYLHIIVLVVGFSALVLRGSALHDLPEMKKFKKVFIANNIWGLSALFLIGTGLIRLFGSYDKPTSYYMHSHWFMDKMTLVVILLLIEIYPMITLIKWRISKKQDLDATDLVKLKRIRIINHIEKLIVILIPLLACAMARGGFI